MKRYEYIRLNVDVGDLKELNNLASTGWRVAGVVQTERLGQFYAILERELPES